MAGVVRRGRRSARRLRLSLALFGRIERDEAFLAACRRAGGRADSEVPARLRLALCRAHLYLTDAVPRAAGPVELRRLRETAAPEPVAALAEIEHLTS